MVNQNHDVMEFTPAFKIEQSSDGLTLTLTDQSNWSDNDEGYVITDFARSIIMVDALNNAIGTVDFPASELVEAFSIVTNQWVKAQLTIIGEQNYDLIQKYGFYRLFQLDYRKAIVGNCGCGKSGIDLCSTDAFLSTAQMAIPIGNGVEFQNDIDAASAYLKPW